MSKRTAAQPGGSGVFVQEHDTGFHAIGELTFQTSTIPAPCYLMEHGDPKVARVAFSGRRRGSSRHRGAACPKNRT